MILPSNLSDKNEWILVGPMGPALLASFHHLPIIAIDGGAHFSERIDIWVGDADSYTGEIKASHVYRHHVEKDMSDLALALSLFSTPCHYKLHLWGFFGGRRDHELFNLGEVLLFLESHQECQALFYDNEGRIVYQLLGAGQWKFTHLGLFSMATLKRTEVKLTGECQYPIKNYKALDPLSSLGLSNMGKGEMTLDTHGPVFLYYPEGK